MSENKTLYYIRGNKERAYEVKAALMEKYPDAEEDDSTDCTEIDRLYFIFHNEIDGIHENTTLGDFIKEHGIELHLPEEKKPELKVNDVVKIINTYHDSPLMVITEINGASISATNLIDRHVSGHPVANTVLVSPEVIDAWNRIVLHKNRYHYSQTAHKVKHWFLPYDKVLVRDTVDGNWKCDFFSHYDKRDEPYPYCTVWGCHKYCIPANADTVDLIGTKDPFKENTITRQPQ